MTEGDPGRIRLAVLEARLEGHATLCEHRQTSLKERLEDAIAELRRQVGELRSGLRRIEMTMYGGVIALLAYLAQRFFIERLGVG